MKLFVCQLLLLLLSSGVWAQQDSLHLPDTVNTAKIFVIRATGHVGSAVNLRFLVDSVVYCKIKNNRYSVIYAPPGIHDFYAASWDGGKPDDKLALKMQVEAGKTYYMSMRIKQRFFGSEIYVEEVTYNTAAPLLLKYKQDTTCD